MAVCAEEATGNLNLPLQWKNSHPYSLLWRNQWQTVPEQGGHTEVLVAECPTLGHQELTCSNKEKLKMLNQSNKRCDPQEKEKEAEFKSKREVILKLKRWKLKSRGKREVILKLESMKLE